MPLFSYINLSVYNIRMTFVNKTVFFPLNPHNYRPSGNRQV